MTKKTIRFVQAQLNARGLDAGPEGGMMGPRTLATLNQVEGIPSDWSKTRKAVAFVQLLATRKNIDSGVIDGYWGPQTEYAFEVLL
jgi:peptidoglycan hydrolase-like protein with peptidoglycan-binding domain